MDDGLVYIGSSDGGRRVVLLVALWSKALHESHDSIYSCYLHTPHTNAQNAAKYWWPGIGAHVRKWMRACRDCGSRKARARGSVPRNGANPLGMLLVTDGR